VPFTRRNIKDLEDIGSRFDGAPNLEFRMATKALELEHSGLSHQRVPPGYRFPYGHTHKQQEEVYVVVHGSGRMKLDDAIVELKEWSAVRVPPGTWRGYEAGPDGLEILVIGAPRPTSATLRAKTSTASATGGLADGALREIGALGSSPDRSWVSRGWERNRRGRRRPRRRAVCGAVGG
jgi:mannose-6-phosphate isomerase-like protein (cupin superfamily)